MQSRRIIFVFETKLFPSCLKYCLIWIIFPKMGKNATRRVRVESDRLSSDEFRNRILFRNRFLYTSRNSCAKLRCLQARKKYVFRSFVSNLSKREKAREAGCRNDQLLPSFPFFFFLFSFILTIGRVALDVCISRVTITISRVSRFSCGDSLREKAGVGSMARKYGSRDTGGIDGLPRNRD